MCFSLLSDSVSPAHAVTQADEYQRAGVAASLQAALALLARRQESLRTHFVERDGQLLQAVLPADDARAAPKLQRRTLPAGACEAELAALLEELAERPFQLVGAGVPLRITLIAAGGDEHLLVVVNHQILRHGRSSLQHSAMLAGVPAVGL